MSAADGQLNGSAAMTSRCWRNGGKRVANDVTAGEVKGDALRNCVTGKVDPVTPEMNRHKFTREIVYVCKRLRKADGLFTPPTRTRQNCLVGGVNTIEDETKLSCLVASAV